MSFRPGVNGLWLAAVLFSLLPAARAQFYGGSFAFTTNRFVATEQEGTAYITVTRDSQLGQMQVDLVATNNTATNGVDFKLTSSGTNQITLTFNHLQTAVTVPVTIMNNGKPVTNSTGAITGGLLLTNVRSTVDETAFVTGVVAKANGTANITIFDDDTERQFNFEKLLYTTPEPNPGTSNSVTLKVKLPAAPGDGAMGIEVDYDVTTGPYASRAGSDFATPGMDYESVQTGTLMFGPNDTEQNIVVNINGDTELEFNEDFHVILKEARGMVTMDVPADPNDPNSMPGTTNLTFALGKATVATVTILYNPSDTQDRPAGEIDTTFNMENAGANNTVFGVAVDANTNTIVVGDFTAINAISRNRIARLDMAGQIDLNFNPTSGANSYVTAVAVYTNGVRSGQVIVGGGFTAINGVQRNGIARLNQDGTTDLAFNPGTGANGPIYAISLQKDGKILVGGDFTTFNGVPRNRVVRLLADGGVDLAFDPGTGANGPVFAVYAVPGDLITITNGMTNGVVGTFSRALDVGATSGFLTLSYNFYDATNDIQVFAGNTLLYNSGLRLNQVISTNAQGNPVTNFPPTVVSLPFTAANSTLTFFVNTGGTNESTNWVFTAQIQPDRALGSYIGGEFSSYNGVEHGNVAKLNDNGSADLAFNLANGIGADGAVYALGVQSGNLILGGQFQTFNSFKAPGVARLLADGRFDRNFAIGDGAQGGIVNAIRVQGDGRILIGGSFIAFNQTRRIYLARLLTDGSLDTGFMDTSFNQYAGFPNASGTLVPNGFLTSLAQDPGGNILVGGVFSRVGGGNTRTDLHARNNVARLLGGDTQRRPGNITFAQSLFGADENAGMLSASLLRQNGRLGPGAVLVSTIDGSAISTNDFTGVTNKAVTWDVAGPNQADGVTGASVVNVVLNDDLIIEGDEQFQLRAFSPTSTLKLGGEYVPAGLALGVLQSATGSILDNDVPPSIVQFSKAEYTANENDVRVTITVVRTGNESSALSVRYDTLQATGADAATPGADYTPVSGSLNFLSGQTNKTFTINLTDDSIVEQDERVLLVLSGLSPGAPTALLGTNATAVLTIIDNDYAPGRVNFSGVTYRVSEGDGQAVITVNRTGGSAGILRANYSTFDNTATAPFDYLEQSGSLLWNDKDTAPRTIVIPIIDDGLVEGTENFSIRLTGADPADALGVRTNATIIIFDNDSLGSFAFNAAEYLADENGTNVTINVVRRGGSAEVASVDYFTTNLTAQAGRDYESVSGTLVFGVGESSKSFVVPIIDNQVQNPERQLNVRLANPQPMGATLGLLTNSVLSIIDNESVNIPAGSVETDFATLTGADQAVQAVALAPDGSIFLGGDFIVVNRQSRSHLAKLKPDGSLDASFGIDYTINDSVRDIELLQDGRIMIAGSFTNIDGLPFLRLARISASGTLDKTFNVGAGADNPVFAVAETFANAESKVLIGGSFSVFNGVNRRGIARVNSDGRTDLTFNPGSGINGTVYAIKVQRDGRILVGGEFTSVNGVQRLNIARLNADGSLDSSFDAGLGPDASVRAIEIQFDDKILIGGLFETVSSVGRPRLARLNSDGTLDSSFNPGSGADGAVYAIALQLDGKIVVGGDFTRFNGVRENRIVRLNPDGGIDPSINFGQGANAFIGALAVQPDRKIVVAGGFTEFDSLPRGHFARLYGGSIGGSGALEFSSANFTANETATNVVITVRRTGGLLGATSVDYRTQGRTASPSVDYVDVSGTLSFGQGENIRTFTIPLIDDNLAENPETVDLILTNATGGAVLGKQPLATLTIISDDSVVSFSDLIYSVNETAPGGRAIIQIIREGDTTSPVSVIFSTSNGTATAGSDYTSVNTIVTIPAGQSNTVVTVPIIDDSIVEDNETVLLRLTAVSSNSLLGRPSATLIILDNDFAPGVLSVLPPSPVSENAGAVAITVIRSSGKTGAISVKYALRDGTATAGQDFAPASGTLSFLEGETSKTFLVQILDDTLVEGNEIFYVELFDPAGGATVGSSLTPVLILDDDFGPGSLDTSFAVGSGAPSPVRDIDIQPDGKILVGGEFDVFNGTFVGGVARLDANGAFDPSFSTGQGAAGTVFSLAETADGKIAVGGDFTSLAGVFRRYVGRLLTNGFGDSTFLTGAGENGRVLAVEAQANGKLVVGGEFTTPARYIMRLNTDGTLDVSFNPDGGTDAPLRDIAIQPDGRVLIAGSFTKVGSMNVRGLARLLSTGLLDSSFKIGAGANGVVNAVVLAPDGKILIGGDFTSVNGVARSRVARLNADGALDTSFNPQGGPNAAVNALLLLRGRIYIGGDFTSVAGSARVRVARLNFDGTLDPEFDPGIGPDASVYALAGQANGQILLGGAFNSVNGFVTPGLARLNGEQVAPAEVRISGLHVFSGTVQFTFSTEVGLSYQIQSSDNLIDWQPVTTVVASSGSTNYSAPASGPRKFYRILLNP